MIEIGHLGKQDATYLGGKAAHLGAVVMYRPDLYRTPSQARVFAESQIDSIKPCYEFNGRNTRFIVRSSFVGEDSTTESLAGKFDSIVTDYQGLEDAARKILAAKHDSKKNVLVHQYIEAKWSGEYFTINPDNNPSLPDLWTAVPGNGGSVEGDKTLPTKAAPKRFQEIGAQLVGLFRCHLDIEWVIDHNDDLWIVQVRPITKRATQKIEVVSGLGVLNEYAVGVALVAKTPDEYPEIALPPNFVLVAPHTNRRWEKLMRQASALVTDHGTATCHAAIFSREIDLPAVIGTVEATQKIRTGDRIYINTLTDPGYGFVHKEIAN